MSITNRIKIIVDNQQLDYKSAEDLGIKFNRIVDDLSDLNNKFGDFSYSFNLPITKNNNNIFKFANAHGKQNKFKPNRDLPCRVYNNDRLLLDGVISLEGITNESYTCNFYSKLKEFTDVVKDKTLKDLEFEEIRFNYETTIRNHINYDYANSDEALYQFPLVFYSTYYCQHSIYDGLNDFAGNAIITDQVYQNYYYCFNSVATSKYNRFYHHQFPMSFYIVRIVEQIFKNAGWTLGGQFWNDENIKKIIMLYAGKQDIYDQATGVVSGVGAVDLQPAKMLPDMKQLDFLKGIINTFNLYFKIDIENKIIKFEPWSTYFGSGFNPYDITNKIKKDSIEINYEENNDPSITFNEGQNQLIMGDNIIAADYNTNIDDITWTKTDDTNYQRFFNKVGTTDEIKLPFAEPCVKRTYLWNDYNSSGTLTNNGATQIITPLMSKQTPEENNSKKFNKNTGHTYVFNTEDTIKFDGKPMLAYYLGQSDNNNHHTNIYISGSLNRVNIGVCSPFQVSSYRDNISDYYNDPDANNSRKTIACTYLQSGYNMKSTNTTDYSLCFDDNGYFHETLWSKFHKAKYDRYANSYVLSAKMVMNDYDWQEMEIDRPIKYNNEIFHIVEIKGYDPIKRLANIKLIKL
jgi:hypothetical protein